jgi:putative transposase
VAAREALDALEDSDLGREYPGIIRRWRESWELVIPFFDFAPEVRKVIYTTNMIESINATLRKSTRNRGHFPSDEALVKVLHLGCKQMGRTTQRHNAGRGNVSWKTALNPVRHHVPRPASAGLTTSTRQALSLDPPMSLGI